jgi:NAD-dependent dihydropyrimidine dehydrogenase PreA subunit
MLNVVINYCYDFILMTRDRPHGVMMSKNEKIFVVNFVDCVVCLLFLFFCSSVCTDENPDENRR